jgi:hypothetical protein
MYRIALYVSFALMVFVTAPTWADLEVKGTVVRSNEIPGSSGSGTAFLSGPNGGVDDACWEKHQISLLPDPATQALKYLEYCEKPNRSSASSKAVSNFEKVISRKLNTCLWWQACVSQKKLEQASLPEKLHGCATQRTIADIIKQGDKSASISSDGSSY